MVGGGDSAVEAAFGLARNPANRVTLSYRKPKPFRIKKKNEDRLMRELEAGTIEAIFQSTVEEIGADSVRLHVKGTKREEVQVVDVPNDYVFIFAGGIPPFAFLRNAGVLFGGESLGEETAVLSDARNA